MHSIQTLITENQRPEAHSLPLSAATKTRNAQLLDAVRDLLASGANDGSAGRSATLLLALRAYQSLVLTFDLPLQEQLIGAILDHLSAVLDTHGTLPPDALPLARALSDYVEFPDGNPFL